MPETKHKILHLFVLIKRLDSKHRLYIALSVALLVLVLTSNYVAFPINLMITWLAYSGCTLIFTWITILYSHPLEVSKMAPMHDSSRTLVFMFVVGAAIISLLAVIVLLQSTVGLSKEAARLHILLSITCVVFAWFLVHTIFTLRYAHYYYSGAEAGPLQKYKLPGGLDFPGESKPDYLDFAYFSFVIGMTFQVSDVEIKSRRIRRLALLHGLISFAFNTVIVALVINVILGVVQK